MNASTVTNDFLARSAMCDAEVVGISKVYSETAAITDLSFAVARGEFFSLLGPSGCGKSTLLRVIAGLEEPTTGSVFIGGQLMNSRPAHRRPTNMVFQGLALFPHMTVSQNVAFGPRLRKIPRPERNDLVNEMLDLVALSTHGARYPHQLSGGQRQRVAIARALANRPTVLLLDEPLGALDLQLRIALQRALKLIQQRSGTTFIYVTHDQTEAMTMSDRVAVMNGGRLEQIATPDDLYSRPTTTFAATFVGETNLFTGVNRSNRLDANDISLIVPEPGTVACVRPERVLIGTTLEPAPENVFDGVVTNVAFRGPTVGYSISLASQRTILAERPADGRQPRLAPGDHTQVGIATKDVVMLDDSPRQAT